MMIKKPKVVFIMGATGTGKSKLSVDIAKSFPAEIINSDKIQAYNGLDIVTNKLPIADRAGIPHHVLGIIPDPAADFTPSQFRSIAIDSASSIASRGKTPLIVGGSNTYLEFLVDDSFLASFECLFLWLDAETSELFSHVDERVDEMVAEGLVEEVREFLDPSADLSRGIWRAIGVPEMARCFSPEIGEEEREGMVEAALRETKVNTRRLVRRQREKIRRLKEEVGWEIKRIDVTEVLRKRRVAAEKESAWENLVVGPTLKLVKDFIGDNQEMETKSKSDQYMTSPPIFVL